jgi:UDP-2,3-diacylglucosamine pyrophosphatase LpxH
MHRARRRVVDHLERLLVVHGDQFDADMEHSCTYWLARLGNALYDFTVVLNDRSNDVRRVLRIGGRELG